MDEKKLKQTVELADNLREAELNRSGMRPLTEKYPNLTIEEAYQIQLYNIQKRLNEGEHIVGKKIGLTSLAMQELLGVDQPDYGHLLENMSVAPGETIDIKRVMQPKVEGEIAFVLKENLSGPDISTEDVLQATDYILPSIEVVDSRIKDWEIKLPDTIADNASCGLYVLGADPVNVSNIDLPQIKMVLEKNGEAVNEGEGSAVLGNPAHGVAWLANKLNEFGVKLKAGEVILSGALSAAVDAEEGDHFTARFDHFGQVSVQF